jgi:DNA-binding transcriptional LysR family regulator
MRTLILFVAVGATTGLDLNLVSVFAKVVELGSFTAAGGALGLPKSSVSRAVTRLEEALGVRLLQRTSRRLRLTQAGDRYLGEVRGAIARIAEASSEVSELGQEPQGLVRVSIAPEIGDGQLSAIFVDFVRRHPRIHLDVIVANRRVNLVEEGIDLAVRAGKLDDSTLVGRRVAMTELALFAAPAYLARRGRPKRLSDLAGHDCILHRTARGLLPWRLTGPGGAEQVTVAGPITVDDLGSVRHLCMAGLGVALMPLIVVRADVERGTLVRVLPGHASKGAAVYVVSPPLLHMPVRVRLMREHLLREIAASVAGTPCAVTADATAMAG